MSLREYYENMRLIQSLDDTIRYSCCHTSRAYTVDKFMEIFRKLVNEKYEILLKNEIYYKRIKSLNEEERKIINMRYASKLTLGDISNKLNTNATYIKRKLDGISRKLNMEL